MAIATTEARWDDDPAGAREALGGVRTAAREGLAEMRALLQELQPQALATAGLVEALREQCEALGYRTGARIEFVPGVPIPGEKLPPQAQEVLFRMAQEALSNVARHARAESVRVALGLEGDAAVLRIEDDGQGFDPRRPPAGLGLRNLEARAASLQGELRIRSAPGSGTAIRVRIPLLRPPEPPRGSLGIHLWREWIGGGLAALAAAWGLATSAPWRHPGRFALVLGATGWYFVVFCLVSLALAADRRRNPSPDAGGELRLVLAGYRSRALCAFAFFVGYARMLPVGRDATDRWFFLAFAVPAAAACLWQTAAFVRASGRRGLRPLPLALLALALPLAPSLIWPSLLDLSLFVAFVALALVFFRLPHPQPEI